jgi:tetratricopeptide (TPR) repeat protein
MPKASDLPDSLKPLARRQAVDVRHSHFGHDAEALVKRMREALGDKPAGPRRWRMRAAIGAAAVAVLLLIGWGGYAFIQHMLTTVEQAAQQREAEFKAELERQARAVTEAEAEAERQRLAAVKAEQERQARAAAELEAKKATEAEQRQPAVVNPEVARRGAWFGVKIQQVTDEIAKSLNITPARGALVVGVVEEGPAKAGGIVVGDVIVKFDGKDIKEVGDIPRIVADTPVGKEVQVTIIRNGAEYTRTVKIGVLTAELEEKRKADEEARARYSAGKTEANAGDYDRAIAYYSEAIRLDPKNAIVFASRGFAYQKKGDYDRAITDYSEAIQLNPTYALVFNNRGNAYQNKGDYDRAIADYSEAIRPDPKNAIAFNNRGNAYGKKGWTTGDYDRAVADYSEAIRLDPQYASAFCNRGRTKLSIKDSGGDEDVAKARQLDASVCR